VTAYIGRLGAIALAGHQIALGVVSTTFMVPLGISSAAAVRVGQAIGRDDYRGAIRAGWTALLLGAGFMSAAAVVLWTLARPISLIFTTDEAVIATSVTLLFVCGFFQLFDGIQIVATGALRGAGQTFIPMLTMLLAYWLIGLPIGYYLAFRRGWGAMGLWTGLCIALILIGLVLLAVWMRYVQAFRAKASLVSPAAELATSSSL
jgi:MATE family multidrug resistance protein